MVTRLRINVAGTRLEVGDKAIIYDRSRDEVRLVNGGGRILTTQSRPRFADQNEWQFSAAATLIKGAT